MMPAAKMMDPVMGIDIHIIQPPGPVPPLPVPHPFVGMLFDPMELAPFIGASVFVNGMPKATAGSEGKALPPHIPIGGMFVPPPPGNECEMFMGSATVLMEGEPASYTALPALSCQSVGMPAPFRPKKKPKPILKLPTSVVMPIPAGPPVLIGGPPTISMSVIGMKLAMGAAMKAAGKLKKMMKASKKVKKVSDRIHKAAKKAMDKLGVPPSVQNKVHKGICSVTGHPVDVATGKVFTDNVDFRLPGPIPLAWERTWYSSSAYQGPLGHGWHFAYDIALAEEGSAAAVRLPDGRSLGFPRLLPGGSFYQRSEKATLSRDDMGYTLRLGGQPAYRFAERPAADGAYPLAAIEAADGPRILFHRNELGKLSGITDSAGRRLRIQSDKFQRILSVEAVDPADPSRSLALIRYRYDERGDLVEALDPLGHSWRYIYRDHLLVQETNRNGLSFHFAWAAAGPGAVCTRTWGDGGIYDHKLAYDFAARKTVVTDSLGNATAYFANEDGLVVRSVDPRGGAWEIAYNPFHEVEKEVEPLGTATLFEYDERGNRTVLTGADGAVLATEYKDDLPVLVIDPLGGKWENEFDAAGNLLRRTDPLKQTWEYRYRGGQLVLSRAPTGAETRLEYDVQGNLAAVTRPNGAVSRWTYDGLGRRLEAVDAYGNVRRHRYDAAGRLVQAELPDGNLRRFSYDPEGNETGRKDAFTAVSLEYRGMNRVAARVENGIRVEFEYDTEERLVAIRNEKGFAWRFAYDPAGDLVSETDFDGATRKFTLDANGRIIEAERPGGGVSKYEYDALDRVLRIEHPDRYALAFAYREDGELMKADSPGGALTFERDALGRVIRENQGSHWVASTYDGLGLRTAIESSLGARQRIARDAMGGADQVALETAGGARWEAAFKRDILGRELERSLPGGLRETWKRDRLGRAAQQNIWSPKFTRRRENDWEMGERLREVRDSAWGSTQYAYDPQGGLLWGQEQDGKVLFRMPDAVGNLFRSEPREDRVHGPSGQLLEARTPKGTVRYEYDAEGNLVKKIAPGGKVWTYAWNGAGLLAEVTRPDGETVAFAYDAMGRRLRKTFRGRATCWVWDRNVPLHEWVEEAPSAGDAAGKPPAPAAVAGNPAYPALEGRPATGPPASALPPDEAGTREAPITWLFEPESFAPMAKAVGAKRYSILTDHIAVPVSMADAEGREVWNAKIDAYGYVEACKGPKALCPFRQAGQYEDEETGLFYNRYRYYDPEIGAYIAKDPISLRGGMEPYAYARNPNTHIDPLGLTHHDDKGHGVYVIADKATGDPVYVGITNDFDRRKGEHTDAGRFDPDKHEYVPVADNMTYGEARGAEQALMEDLETKEKGKRGKHPGNVVDSVAGNRLDNPADAREKAFKDGYDKHKGTLDKKAREKIKKACGT